MGIKEFIQNEVLLPRLRKSSVLVVYDPDRRYRELCLGLATPTRRVIDASESSIESREAALATLQDLGKSNTELEGMLVYVPAPAPLNDEEKQRDPFALYGEIGAVFPESDGDEYLNLCLRAKADHATEIRRLFNENPNPSFAVIDAVGAGVGWPTLQAALSRESARDILFALLAPSEKQKAELKKDTTWIPEAKALFESTLGLTLITRSTQWETIADELWRFLLFSEFAFDLPESSPLPAELASVPRAQREAEPLVNDLCDRLRNDRRTQGLYIERAEEIEKLLRIPEACRAIEDLGVRDTFPFEERTFFDRAVDALKRDNVDQLRELLRRHDQSIWVGRGENQSRWLVLRAAARLVEACEDGARQLPEHARTQEALIDFYLTSLREVDRLQREFEQAAGDSLDTSGQLEEVTARARRAYQGLANRVRDLFVRHLECSGWPPPGRLANADLFDRLVAPKLQESGRRVALFLIDALRYELGVELQKRLAEEGQVELQAAFAQLPTVTPVGMASLLPGASQALRLVRKGDQMAPALGEQLVTNVSQRMEVLRNRYGQRFAEATLTDFVRGRVEVPRTVELLVLRSNEMDNDFESNPEAAPGLINRTFQRIVAAIRKLREMGFQDALIASDHGFYLNPATGAGDVCGRPPGNWVTIHDRLLLGDGAADGGNLVVPAEHLGIRGEFSQAAMPRAMVAYRTGQWYFHGGASLQEAVVPAIAVRLTPLEEKLGRQPSVTIRYKRGAKRITTRLPVIEVEIGAGDLFSQGSSFDILLEAHDDAGNVVGEAQPGDPVNPATGTITVKPGDTVQVTLRMDLDFEGSFTVKALDPTTLTEYSRLDLETDYTV